MAYFELHECFETMNDLRNRLRMFSVTNNCPYIIIHSDCNKLEARCPSTRQSQESSNSCDFRIAAYRHKDGFIHLHEVQLEHSDHCPAIATASSQAIKEIAKPFVTNFIVVRPKDICNIIKNEYGVSPSYSTAWRALSGLKMENQLEQEVSFMLVEDFFYQFANKNPGTVTKLERNVDDTFRQAFLCPTSSKLAFAYCRPIVIMDACHIKSVYGGVILSACTHDGEGHILPLAIGIGPIENEENWMFFIRSLRDAIPEMSRFGIVAMHDREKGIQNALSAILPNAHESICVFHLEKNVHSAYKSKFMGKIWSAAKAFNDKDFELAMQSIKEKDFEAATYLMRSNPAKWARSKFPVPRFGCVTSNSAESLNSWIEDIRNSSHFNVFSGWISKLSQLLFKRHQEYRQINTLLPPLIEQQFIKNRQEGRRLEIIQYTEDEFEFKNRNTGRQYFVNLKERTCTCGEFTEFQFPCIHAAVAIENARLWPLDFMDPSYTVNALRSVYQNLIRPVDISNLKSDKRTRPPIIWKKRGRPKLTRIRSRGNVDLADQVSCSQCGAKGHNKRTCLRRQARYVHHRPIAILILFYTLFVLFLLILYFLGQSRRRQPCRIFPFWLNDT